MNKSKQLLLIDDDRSVLETFRFWLEDEGYEVYTAVNKKEAIRVLQNHSIAVALIDLKMKDENGLQVSVELKKFDALLKIIIITGYPTYETAIDAMKMGIFDYISKSSENIDILKKIENAVEKRQEEIAEKEKQTEDQKGIALVCNHMMIKEGFENFCSENSSGYHLIHNYHSVGYVKNRDFNNDASLVLVCHTCNQNYVDQPEKMVSHLNSFFPKARIVMINCNLSDEKKLYLIKLGVKGFMPKNIFKENMKKAFEAVLSGQMWISRQLSQRLLSELMEQAANPNTKIKKPKNSFNLSNREIEILDNIAAGLSNLQISEKLFISEKTVKAHINHIFKKMSVKSRTQAVKKAAEEGIIH